MSLFAKKVKCAQCGTKVEVVPSANEKFLEHWDHGRVSKMALRCKACHTTFCSPCVFPVNEERISAEAATTAELLGLRDAESKVKNVALLFAMAIHAGRARCPSCKGENVGFCTE